MFSKEETVLEDKKLEEIKTSWVADGHLVKIDIEDFNWLINQLEHYQLTRKSPITYEEMVNSYEDRLGTLEEQLDISQRLRNTEFTKALRYEKALCALLKLACDSEQKVLIDIISDALQGYDLTEKHHQDSSEGKNILSKILY